MHGMDSFKITARGYVKLVALFNSNKLILLQLLLLLLLLLIIIIVIIIIIILFLGVTSSAYSQQASRLFFT
jgi:hypothetical protein